MERPFFSVIVPVYNVQNYLDKCIESILCQTYPHFELILVDDGSTDGCKEICDREKENDERIVVIHKQNGGLVSARKAGAMAASGDPIICVDGDDWIDKNMLTEASNIVLRHDPDLISFGYYEAYGEDSRSISYWKTKEYSRDEIIQEIYPALIYPPTGKRFPNNIWGKIYKTDLYLEHQFLAFFRQMQAISTVRFYRTVHFLPFQVFSLNHSNIFVDDLFQKEFLQHL